MQERIIEIISKLKNNEELKVKLNGESHIVEDAELDSLEVIQFILEVCDELDIEIDFDMLELEDLSSINKFCAMLESA